MGRITAFRIKVFGMVQGVGFRYYTKQEADALELKGWVMNCSDGTVDIQVQGPEASVIEFIEWCQSGPSTAHVDKLEIDAVESEELKDFVIKR